MKAVVKSAIATADDHSVPVEAAERAARASSWNLFRKYDEIGYLSYDARAADLLFEVITRRYQRTSTIVSTNKPFAQWHEIFPNASSVVTLIDRLTHQAEILVIEAESYRLKESRERTENRQCSRRAMRKKPASP